MRTPASTLRRTPLRQLIYKAQQHPFHILPASPYPPLVGLTVLLFITPLTAYLHSLTLFGFSLGYFAAYLFAFVLVVALAWFTAIVQDSAFGFHTRKVQEGLRFGVLLFILSEVMLFFAFFWGFFHVSLSPSIAIGDMWPPVDTQPLQVWGLPLVNTLLLLSSGLTVTLAHAFIVQKRGFSFFWNLTLTILLGVVFLLCQSYEYQYGVLFSFRENIYGSIFFLTTGFHGLHVTIGTLFLLFNLLRYLSSNTVLTERLYQTAPSFSSLSSAHHLGFEAAAWYWHFVDVVWLFLFLSVYWWGGAAAPLTEVAAATEPAPPGEVWPPPGGAVGGGATLSAEGEGPLDPLLRAVTGLPGECPWEALIKEDPFFTLLGPLAPGCPPTPLSPPSLLAPRHLSAMPRVAGGVSGLAGGARSSSNYLLILLSSNRGHPAPTPSARPAAAAGSVHLTLCGASAVTWIGLPTSIGLSIPLYPALL